MDHFYRNAVKQAFASYSDKYNSSDPKIRLKINHTYRVADLCDRIAQTVPGTNTDLAWLCGMLHDIGRFEQVRRYNTFFDAQSVDHAAFGADLLFKEGLLDVFGDYDEDITYILETSIRNHNKFRIDEDITEECIPYCHILRDADKIDILRVNIDTPPEQIYNTTTAELVNAPVSDAAKKAFTEGHAILRSDRTTPIDYLVGHISLVYELVYPISVKIVNEQGYLLKLLDFHSENAQTREWFNTMHKVLRERKILAE